MTDVDTLVGQLTGQLAGTAAIVLDGTLLSDDVRADIRTAFALADDADLTVTGDATTAQRVGSSAVVSGGTAAVLGQDAVPVHVEFAPTATATDVVITATLPDSWTFTDSFPELDTFPFTVLAVSEPAFVFTTVRRDGFVVPREPATVPQDPTPITVEVGQNVAARVTLAGLPVIAALLPGLVPVAPLPCSGPFGPRAGQRLPVGTIRIPLTADSLSVGVGANVLALTGPSLAVRIGEATDDSPIQPVDLVVEADFGSALAVSVDIPVSGDSVGVSVAPVTPDQSVLAVIEALPGGSRFTAVLPDEVAGLFATVGLDDFTMVVDTTPAVSYIGLGISTEASWPLIEPDVLTLNRLRLRIDITDPAGENSREVRVDGQATFLKAIFPGDFTFTVLVEQDSGSGWRIGTVAGTYSGTVSLGDIVAGLVGSADSVPAALRALTLYDFGVAVTRTDPSAPFAYALHGSAATTFPILDTTLIARLNLSMDTAAPGRPILLGGGLMIGDEAFEISLDLTTGGALLRADWHSTGAPLEFGDIATALGWTDMPALPDGLDLALTSAGFSYDFAGGLLLTATSVHYGQLVFRTWTTPAGRQYFLDLGLALDLGLSDIPVVGRQIPAALNVGVRNVELSYASAALAEADVTALNDALQALQGTALNATTYPAGVAFAAVLSLGGDEQRLSLTQNPSPAPAPEARAPRPAAAPAAPAAPAAAAGARVDVGRSFGPLRIDRIGMQYTDGSLMFAIDAGVALGPLVMSVDGLAIGSPVTQFQPRFTISGLGLSYDKAPLEILGAILHVPNPPPDVTYQFDGMLVLKAEAFSLAAIGSYAELTSGMASLFVFAQLEAQLGGPPAFFVTGLMAGFGYNRTLVIPGQDEVAGFPLLRLASPPEPGQPPQDPTTILQVLEGTASLDSNPPKAWITPKAGEYWLAAGIEFTSFELVSTKAMLVVEFGDDLTIALLGLSTLRLPQQVESPETYAYVEMMIRVVVRPEQGVFEATAILSPNSYVITPDGHLTGGFAFSLWFGASPYAGQFVATLGGYHPAFQPPDYYPVVPRLGFNWAVSDVVTMKGEAYFALTPSCVMAGGALDVLFSDGGLRAWCTAHADFLVAWRPFRYQASIAVSIGVSYQLNVLGCTKTLSASLGADLELVGPPTSGTARVNYVVISFTIRFGTDDGSAANTKPLGWTEFAALLPGTDVLCRITAGDGLYRTQPSTDSSGSRWIVRAQQFAFQTSSAIPASQVVYGDHATAVTDPAAAGIAVRPMNLADVASTHTLKIYRGTESTPVDPTGWGMAPVRRPVPGALWGTPPAPFTQMPARPSADTVPDQITGLSVTAPAPAIGASRGPVVAQVLAEEYLSPSGRTPVVAGTAPVTRYLPVFDDGTVGLVGQIAGPDAAGGRAALFAALHGSGVLDATDGALTGLAAGAAHLFSDPPMRQD